MGDFLKTPAYRAGDNASVTLEMDSQALADIFKRLAKWKTVPRLHACCIPGADGLLLVCMDEEPAPVQEMRHTHDLKVSGRNVSLWVDSDLAPGEGLWREIPAIH